MKLISIFFAAVFVFAQNSQAVSLPKTAKVVLALDQPAVVIELPELDFTGATIQHGLIKFKKTGTITVGNSSYQMDLVAFANLHVEAKGLTVENVKALRYRLFSQEINSIVGDVVVDMKTGNVSMNKNSFKGIVTAWY
jgi:hypothetical protein